MRVRAGVVILRDDRVALIRRQRHGRIHYTFPGGGVEPGETPEAAAVREAYEELGLHVELVRLVATVEFGKHRQHYYLAAVAGGEFGTGTGPEFTSPAYSRRGSYLPVWVALRDLPALDVRPPGLAAVLARRAFSAEGLPLRIRETE